MSPVRHAIFDLDGTLVDSLPGIGGPWSGAAACGLPPLTRDLAAADRPARSATFWRRFPDVTRRGHVLDRLESAFRASYDSEGWRRTVCHAGRSGDAAGDCSPAASDLWVVTNKPAAATSRILRELKLDGFFRGSRVPRFAEARLTLRRRKC